MEKTLASGLADAFSQHTPAWRPSVTPNFSQQFLRYAKAQGHLRSIMGDGFQNPVQARLRRDLKAQRQIGSPKHSPALFCPLFHPCLSCPSVVPKMILPIPFCAASPPHFHSSISRRSRKARRKITRFLDFRFTAFLFRCPDFWKNIIRPPSTAFGLQKNSSRDQITQIPQRRIRRAFRDFRPF